MEAFDIAACVICTVLAINAMRCVKPFLFFTIPARNGSYSLRRKCIIHGSRKWLKLVWSWSGMYESQESYLPSTNLHSVPGRMFQKKKKSCNVLSCALIPLCTSFKVITPYSVLSHIFTSSVLHAWTELLPVRYSTPNQLSWQKKKEEKEKEKEKTRFRVLETISV